VPPAGRVLVAAVLLLAAAVLVAAVGVGATTADPVATGTTTRWALSGMRLLLDLAAALTIGLLVLAVITPPPDSRQSDRSLEAAVLVLVSRWAVVWCACAVVVAVLTLAEVSGAPLAQALTRAQVASFVVTVPQGRSLAFVVAVTAVLAAVTRRAARRLQAAPARTRATRAAEAGPDSELVLILALTGVVPPALTGHAADAAGHSTATFTIVVHVVAVTVWVGTLAALVLHAPLRQLPQAVERFSPLALWCYIAAGVSGLANAWVRLGAPATADPLFATSYGWLVLAKIAAFTALGAFGWWHRRGNLPIRTDDGRHRFLRFAAVEVAVMACTIALAVGLARTPPPASAEIISKITSASRAT
jgi:putative copper export protein